MRIIHCYHNVFREASEFILEQKAKSIPVVEEAPKKLKGFVVRRGRKCAGIRHYYSTQFNRIVSAKVTDYLVATLSSRRTKNQRKISEFLLTNLNDVTGEKFTLQYPKTLAQKIMVFFTDRVSGWLSERVSEAEELLKEDREIEELKAEKKKREKEKTKKQGKSSDKKGGKTPTEKSDQSSSKEDSTKAVQSVQASKEDSKKAEENPIDESDQPEAQNPPEDSEAEN